MDAFVLNGFEDIFGPMNGTSQAIPMNGTSQAIPMNGTSQAIPMNGTSQAIPMQGLNGSTFYVSPLALMDEDEVPMQGVPDYYTDEDRTAYRVAYLVGDQDAMNGLFDKFKARREEKKAAKAERKAEKEERKALRMENKRVRLEKRKSGTSFLDKFGGALANLGEAKKLEAQAAQDLEDEGIDYDPDVLAERSALASEAGAKSTGGGGIGAWWNERSTGEKVGIGILGATVLYFGGRAVMQMVGSNKKRK